MIQEFLIWALIGGVLAMFWENWDKLSHESPRSLGKSKKSQSKERENG